MISSKYECDDEILYKCFFSWVPNIRFIRDSHRSAKKKKTV